MIARILALFDGRPWAGMTAHPRTLADVLCAMDRRPEAARIAAEVAR